MTKPIKFKGRTDGSTRRVLEGPTRIVSEARLQHRRLTEIKLRELKAMLGGLLPDAELREKAAQHALGELLLDEFLGRGNEQKL